MNIDIKLKLTSNEIYTSCSESSTNQIQREHLLTFSTPIHFIQFVTRIFPMLFIKIRNDPQLSSLFQSLSTKMEEAEIAFKNVPQTTDWKLIDMNELDEHERIQRNKLQKLNLDTFILKWKNYGVI
jgi:hypothetical protein